MAAPVKELSIPERTLRTLSFCEPTPRHLEEWLTHLPMVNLGEASRQLYHAIIEINQLIIEPDLRIKLLELLRPPILRICDALNKYYLNQPLLLPEKARKVSRLAMALDNHLAVGYKIVVHDNAKSDYSLLSRKPRKLSTLAIHSRAGSVASVASLCTPAMGGKAGRRKLPASMPLSTAFSAAPANYTPAVTMAMCCVTATVAGNS